jgi:hypothetical protein
MLERFFRRLVNSCAVVVAGLYDTHRFRAVTIGVTLTTEFTPWQERKVRSVTA